MYGPLKSQKQRPGRNTVRGAASYSAGFPGISISELQRSSIINRHFQTIFREQQRDAGPMREGVKASRVDQQRHNSQGEEGTPGERFVNRDKEGGKTQQGKLVRSYLAIVGLVAGDGYIKIRIQERCVSGKQIQTPRKWSRRAKDSFRKWSKGMPNYFRNWSYTPLLGGFPTPDSEHYLDIAIYCAN